MLTLLPERGRFVPGLLLLFAALALPAARVRGDDAKEITGDLKLLQGNWVFSADEVDAKWFLEGDTVKVSYADMVFVCTLTINSTANPHTVDFFVKEGPDDVVGKTTLGIYKIEGDQVTFCVRRPGEMNRPTEFKDLEDETFTFVLKKAK